MNYKLIARRLRAMADEIDGGTKDEWFEELELAFPKQEETQTIEGESFTDLKVGSPYFETSSKGKTEFEKYAKNEAEELNIFLGLSSEEEFPEDYFCSVSNQQEYSNANNGFYLVDSSDSDFNTDKYVMIFSDGERLSCISFTTKEELKAKIEDLFSADEQQIHQKILSIIK